jgi:hypothetical protein
MALMVMVVVMVFPLGCEVAMDASSSQTLGSEN